MDKLSKKIENIRLADVVLFFAVLLLYTAYNHPVFSLVGNGLLYIFSAIILLEKRGNFRIYAVCVVYGAFALLSLSSCLYSVAQAETITRATTLIELVPPIFAAANYFSEKANIKKFMFMIVTSAIATCLYIFVTEDIFSGGPIGRSIGNQNGVATTLAIAVVFLIYYVITKFRWWYVPIVMLLVTFIILSGSRSALLTLVISGIFMLILGFKARKQSVGLAVLIILAVILLGIYLIFNVEFLYNAIGERIEGALDLLQTGDGDVSSNKRAGLIRNGWQMFMNNPIFGCGLGSFIFEYEELTGLILYSHNNYLELLVGIGFVGALTYYIIYLICLRSAANLLNRNKRTASRGALAFSLMVAIMVSDFFTVNYNNKIVMILLVFVYGIYISEKETVS